MSNTSLKTPLTVKVTQNQLYHVHNGLIKISIENIVAVCTPAVVVGVGRCCFSIFLLCLFGVVSRPIRARWILVAVCSAFLISFCCVVLASGVGCFVVLLLVLTRVREKLPQTPLCNRRGRPRFLIVSVETVFGVIGFFFIVSFVSVWLILSLVSVLLVCVLVIFVFDFRFCCACGFGFVSIRFRSLSEKWIA